jgi:2-dehydro-3-deoxygalactonokinase
MDDGEFLACDWGTTHLRAWGIGAGGNILRRELFPWGVAKLTAGEAERKFHTEVRPRMQAQALPAFLCGMIGSDLGWIQVSYEQCPAGLGKLAASLRRLEAKPGVWIVPGLLSDGVFGAPDVMRGEETQLLGWVAQDASRKTGRIMICHPGTHTKWTLVVDGQVIRFVTYMTGELFDVLRTQSILRTSATADDHAAFDEGVAAASDGNALAARLFTIRARTVTGIDAPEASASYLSGLLIGAEVASIPRLLPTAQDMAINLLGDDSLCRRYARALSNRGVSSTIHSGENAVIAGLRELKAIAKI